MLTDMEIHHETTGNQMTGTAHQTVSVKNCFIANMSDRGGSKVYITLLRIEKVHMEY